jgi:hypothetical protein
MKRNRYSQDFENDRDNASIGGGSLAGFAPSPMHLPAGATPSSSSAAMGVGESERSPSTHAHYATSTHGNAQPVREAYMGHGAARVSPGGPPEPSTASASAHEAALRDLRRRLGGGDLMKAGVDVRDPLAGTLLASQELFRKQLSILRARVGLINNRHRTSEGVAATENNSSNSSSGGPGESTGNMDDPLAFHPEVVNRSVPSLAELKAQFAARRAQTAALTSATVSLTTALRELDPNLSDAGAKLLAQRYTT